MQYVSFNTVACEALSLISTFFVQLNTAIGGDDGSIYLITGDLGSNSGEGLDFIDGFAFLERFYYVFDVTNSQVGFATTEFTDATTN